jgi:4-hydroxybenzoate polyprenyltransferase
VRALAELVRAPAALTVLGDTLAGASASGKPLRGRRLLLPLSSVAFYWAGMALNDWSDRDLDKIERPERPIPSGRIAPGTALATAAGLSAAGLGLAGLGGGRHALPVATALAASVWAYDIGLKSTAAGPAAMAACRSLDVLLGAGRIRSALPSALALGLHTLGVTALSRGEVHGGSPEIAGAALAGTAVSAGLAVSGRGRSPGHRLAALAIGTAYAAQVAAAQLDAARRPGAQQVRKATAAGIHGMILLQASMTARHGSIRAAALLTGALPLARLLARRVSPT